MSIETQTKGSLDTAGNLGKEAKETATEAMDKSRKIFARAVDQMVPAVKETLHDVEARATDFYESTTAQIRKHPIQSLLIGFGVGALLGAAFRGLRRQAA